MAKKLNIQAALMKAGANVGGGVAAAAINKVGFVNKQKMIIRGAAKLALGALLPSFVKAKGKTAEVVTDFAAGWNAVAGIELVNGILTKNGENAEKALSISGIGQNGYILGNDYAAPAATYHLGATTDEQPAPPADIM